MSNPFDSSRMAAGYAHSRPPVHAHVAELIQRKMPLGKPVSRALDVGCGTGLSTAALRGIARWSIGIEPSEAMLRWSSEIDTKASFLAGSAEALPFRSHSMELITAAGSLNWVDLDRFFDEARRVLTPGGRLIVYDFGQGRDIRGMQGLGDWERQFKLRYPSPPCRRITPEGLDLDKRGFRLEDYEEFEVGLLLTPGFYLEYVMTETNVADAVARGVPEDEIRHWCREGIDDIFGGEAREVLFRGYIAWIADQKHQGSVQ